MAKAGGYILRLSRERLGVFDHAMDMYGRFAEAVPSFNRSRNAPLVCFIVDPSGHVSHIGRGRRGVNAGTEQSRLNIDEIHSLDSAVSIDDIIVGVPNRNRKAVEDRFQNGGLLSPNRVNVLLGWAQAPHG